MKTRVHQRRTIGPWVVGLTIVALFFLIARLVYIVAMMVILRNIGYGDEQMVSFAQARLHSRNIFIRDAAARGLGSIGPEAAPAVSDLLLVLNTDKRQAATSAAAALGYIHAPLSSGQQVEDPKVVSELIGALSHRDQKFDGTRRMRFP